jgi:hypothetical protein
LYQLGYENIATGTIETKHLLGTSGSPRSTFQRETSVEYIDQDLQVTITDQGMKKINTIVYYINSVTKEESQYNLTTILTNR